VGARGIWALKCSIIGLLLTAFLQAVIAYYSGSVALLADTIHKTGDALTAIPLWIAFRMSTWKPSARFTYGYGWVEDLAGIAIILTILLSAALAGYESISRLFHASARESRC
jgi:cation diffusion facilitator family transporter